MPFYFTLSFENLSKWLRWDCFAVFSLLFFFLYCKHQHGFTHRSRKRGKVKIPKYSFFFFSILDFKIAWNEILTLHDHINLFFFWFSTVYHFFECDDFCIDFVFCLHASKEKECMLLFSMDINSILFSLDMHVVMKIYLTKLSCVSLYYYYVQPRYSACYSACSVALIILHASTTLTPLRFLSPNLLSPLFPSLLPNSYEKKEYSIFWISIF